MKGRGVVEGLTEETPGRAAGVRACKGQEDGPVDIPAMSLRLPLNLMAPGPLGPFITRSSGWFPVLSCRQVEHRPLHHLPGPYRHMSPAGWGDVGPHGIFQK